MNYRHAYHAGNFADVVKHASLALILDYLNNKDAAWRFIDTHGGLGAYDLAADEPARTGEWLDGVGRLAPALGLALPEDGMAETIRPLSAPALDALVPYRTALHAANPDGILHTYPGSPGVARALARRQDRILTCELHPADADALQAHFAGDQQVKVRTLDGWLALGAFVPPKERRGLVLVDPPFEAPGEYERLAAGLKTAHRRWATGTYMLWHAIKDMRAAHAYIEELAGADIAKMLLAELFIRSPTGETFDGCGLVFVNPPYTLESHLSALLPALAQALSAGPGARHSLRWLRGE